MGLLYSEAETPCKRTSPLTPVQSPIAPFLSPMCRLRLRGWQKKVRHRSYFWSDPRWVGAAIRLQKQPTWKGCEGGFTVNLSLWLYFENFEHCNCFVNPFGTGDRPRKHRGVCILSIGGEPCQRPTALLSPNDYEILWILYMAIYDLHELRNISSYKLNLPRSGKGLGGREGYFYKSHSLSFAPQSISQATGTLKSTSRLLSWEKSYCVLAAQHFKWRVPHVAFTAISQGGDRIHSTKEKTPQTSKICEPFSTSWRSGKSTQAISSSKNLLVDASAVARLSCVFKRWHW